MNRNDPFFNLYSHDMIRVAVGVPELKVADPLFNAEKTLQLMKEAVQERAVLALFPEMGLSAYSCDDLFHQQTLLQETLDALEKIRQASETLSLITVVGLPLVVDDLLFNCGVVLYRGQVLGCVPKTYLPGYREFYETRQFAPATAAISEEVELCGQRVPFGSQLLFQVKEQPLLRFHLEICEDLWVPIPPSSYAAMAGATVFLNLSASNITIGKAEYRHQLVANQSARCLGAYLYSAAGTGESTTDLAWDGHAMIYENGSLLAESERFAYESHLLLGDIDLERLSVERMRQNSFGLSRQNHKEQIRPFRTIRFSVALPHDHQLPTLRQIERFPYVPSNPTVRDRRCYEAYQIQVQGLVKRLKASGIQKLVIGISGGLDSTQALIVAARAMDILNLPRTNILAYTMPGYATSQRTLQQALDLMSAVGCKAHEIDIRPSCEQMFHDIGHPFVDGEPVYDITFENVQAGERTNHLFRLANHHSAMVLGTGDLSELALGWCTYGVGDHMSHYNVNASVPKTLIQFLIQWVAQTEQLGVNASQVLFEILATEISPELIPGDEGDEPAQITEDVIGPYPLQDFNLFYTLRYGFKPDKIAYYAWHAWKDIEAGRWPDLPESRRKAYTLAEIKKNLRIFLWRFFQTSQFKRSCVPNAPKVGSGGSLSPRGDYRAPSDSEARSWMRALDLIPDTHEDKA